MMSPGFRPFWAACRAVTNSLPVGMTATRGLRRTLTLACPLPASAPRSTGLSVWLAGSTSSLATMSSPIGLMALQGATLARISMAWVPSGSLTPCTCSIMMTASAQQGMASPVST